MLRQHWRPLRAVWAALEALGAMAIQLLLITSPPHELLGDPGTNATVIEVVGTVLAVGLGSLACLTYYGGYESQRRRSLREQVATLLRANLLLGLCYSALAFTLRLPVPPLMPAVFALCLLGAQSLVRIPTFTALQALRRAGRNYRNVLVIGTGPRAAAAARTISLHPEWGLRVVGFVDAELDRDFFPSVPAESIHKMMDLPGLLREETVDEVLVACPRSMIDLLAPAVRECTLIGVPVTLLTDLFGNELPPPRAGRFDDLGTISFAPVHHNAVELVVKRGMDIVGALVGLVLSAPLVAASAIAIKLDDGGPVLFRQGRCGLNGRRFQMLKLRTMVPDAERLKADLMHLNEMDGPVFKIKEDPRTTRVGRTLREWSLDELPQFWNVLRGDMSLVGPRPPTPDEVILYEGPDRRRLSMRPGLTCLWQVSGRNEVDFEEWMRLDRAYIDSWSLWRDIGIILRTIPQLVSRRGAS